MMNNEQYLNSFTYIEFYAMLLREVLRLVSIKNRYDEKFVIEITSKLKFQKKLILDCLKLVWWFCLHLIRPRWPPCAHQWPLARQPGGRRQYRWW